MDAFLSPEWMTGRERHTFANVYGEMLLEISAFYSGLPDGRTLELDEIVFYYNGLRPTLHKRTKN